MSEWQPIETAPKDGTSVLAWEAKEGIAIVEWSTWSFRGGKFNVTHDAEDYAWADYCPTHWMPLPEAPKP